MRRMEYDSLMDNETLRGYIVNVGGGIVLAVTMYAMVYLMLALGAP